MRRKMIFTFLVLLVFRGANAQTWDPERIVGQAIGHSPRVRGNEDRVAALQGALRQAKAISNPEIGGITGNRTRMLAVGQRIEYPGKRRLRIRRAEARVEAARWRLVRSRHEVAAEAMAMLYRILASHRKVALFQENLAVATQLFSAAQEKFSQGFGSRLDVIKGQVEVARARRLLLNAQEDNFRRQNDLKLTLGLSPADTLQLVDVLEDALLPRSVRLDSLLQFVEEHPRLKEEHYRVQAADLDLQSAAMATRPDLDFDLAGGIDDDESRVELELRLPLALWDRKAGRKAEARSLAMSARSDSASAWLDVSREVSGAFYDYRNAQRIVRLFGPSLLDESQTAARLAQQAFQTGQYRFLDLIDARRTYLETAQEFIDALASLRIAEVELLRATGTLFEGETE